MLVLKYCLKLLWLIGLINDPIRQSDYVTQVIITGCQAAIEQLLCWVWAILPKKNSDARISFFPSLNWSSFFLHFHFTGYLLAQPILSFIVLVFIIVNVFAPFHIFLGIAWCCCAEVWQDAPSWGENQIWKVITSKPSIVFMNRNCFIKLSKFIQKTFRNAICFYFFIHL